MKGNVARERFMTRDSPGVEQKEEERIIDYFCLSAGERERENANVFSLSHLMMPFSSDFVPLLLFTIHTRKRCYPGDQIYAPPLLFCSFFC